MTDWPHAPPHWFHESGTYMITAGTHGKKLLFDSEKRRTLLHDTLLSIATEANWELHAWAVFANHYHFVGHALQGAKPPSKWLGKLHMITAKSINLEDDTPGRKVWFQFRDTELTHERSYLARLAYVHQNAVHHGLVTEPSAYRWCSAAWFQQTASAAFYKSVMGFKTDRVNVPDDY